MTAVSADRTPYRLFSLQRLAALTGNTFTQLMRMKVFYFLLFFCVLVLVSAFFVNQFTFDQELKVLKDMSLASMSAFASLFAIAATAMLLPRDLEDRTLYTILAKPVSRFEYLLGKYLGVMAIIAVSLAVMTVLFFVILFFRQQSLLAHELAQLGSADPRDIELVKQTVAEQGVTWNLLNAIVAIGLKAAVVAAVTLLVSTFASTSLFTIIVAVALFLIGHLQPLLLDFWRHTLSPGPIGHFLLSLLGVVFPNLQLFNVVDGVVSGEVVPFATMGKLVGLGLAYVGVYLFVAYLFFYDKEL
ncbi:MAG: ABC transporter permease subunit [Verrucomicrobiota bacterium]